MGRKHTLHDSEKFFWLRTKVGHPIKVYKRYFGGTQADYDGLTPSQKKIYLTPRQSRELYDQYAEIEENRTLKSVIADENIPAKSNPTTSWELDGIINRSDFDPDWEHEIDTVTAPKTYLGKLTGKKSKKPKSYKVPINTPKKKKSLSGKRGRPKNPNAIDSVLKRYKKADVDIGKTKTIDGVTFNVYPVNNKDESEKLRNNLRKHSSKVKDHDARKYDPKARKGTRIVLYK